MKQALGPWVDSHCHLADPRLDPYRETWVQQAQARGIQFFLQGGVDPLDWQRQLELKKIFPLGLCFGLHPYWVAEHDESECEKALDVLAKLLPQAMALGELGLDFRPHIMKESQALQIDIFEEQLALAEVSGKPLVLHVVQGHEEALQIFNVWGVPKAKGIVHSFNGSWHKAQDFLKLGLSLSVGGPVVREDNHKLHQAVRECPLEFLLIETDSPDQPPPKFKDKLNPPESLLMVAQAVADLKQMTAHQILDISTSNFRRIFGENLWK